MIANIVWETIVDFIVSIYPASFPSCEILCPSQYLPLPLGENEYLGEKGTGDCSCPFSQELVGVPSKDSMQRFPTLLSFLGWR